MTRTGGPDGMPEIIDGMDLKLTGQPGGSGLWETVKVAIQGGWPTTMRLAVLLCLIYLLCKGAEHAAVAEVANMIRRH